MLSSKLFKLLNLLVVGISADTTNEYNYTLNGADWGATFPLCANGSAQTPINLNDVIAIRSEKLAIRGVNYPNNFETVVSRDKATSLPTDVHSEF